MQENKVIYNVSIIIMAALAAIFCLGSCRQRGNVPTVNQHPAEKGGDSILQKRILDYNQRVYHAIVSTAKPGDLITRMGTDITSLILSRININDTSYSHCGIISVENDSVFVYHAIGGEFNPDQKMKREWLYRFAHPKDCRRLGLFSASLDKQQCDNLLAQLDTLYQQGLPFDMAFDLYTDDRMYCSELVAKTFSKVIGNTNWYSVTTADSLAFISIESLYSNKWMKEKKRFHY